MSSAHDAGRVPSLDRRRLATWAEVRTLTVLLGPLSDVELAMERRDSVESVAGLRAWLRVMPIGSVTFEVVCHLSPAGQRGSVAAATRMLCPAEDTGTPAVFSNAVRYGEPTDATTADLADATRLLTPLAQLEEPQANGQAWLKDGLHMRQVARMVVDAGARNPDALDQLLRTTQQLADRCALDPAADIGLSPRQKAGWRVRAVVMVFQSGRASLGPVELCAGDWGGCFQVVLRQQRIGYRRPVDEYKDALSSCGGPVALWQPVEWDRCYVDEL